MAWKFLAIIKFRVWKKNERKKERNIQQLASRELIHRHDDIPFSGMVRTLTLWLLHACVTRSRREINILRTRMYYPQTHYSHVHSVECIFSHAANVFQDTWRLGTDRVASSARSCQRKSYHVFIKSYTYSASHCNNSRNHRSRVHDHASTTPTTRNDTPSSSSTKCSRCLMSISSLEKPVNNN